MISLTEEMLTTKPEEFAKKIAKIDKSTQIRKFYNDFLILQAKAKDCETEEEFKEKILPLIYFSKAKLAYAKGRKTISEEFMKEIDYWIGQIKSRNDFENFMYYYQALIGYATFHLKA